MAKNFLRCFEHLVVPTEMFVRAYARESDRRGSRGIDTRAPEALGMRLGRLGEQASLWRLTRRPDRASQDSHIGR